MSQTFSEGISTLPPQEIQKQRIKQAKRQTKMMLKVQQAKKDVQKAQMKSAKAQLGHEIATTRLRTFEEQINQMREQGSNDK